MIEFQPNIHYHKVFETYILGICLIEPQAHLRVGRIINVDCFYFDQHKIIWQAITDMAAQAEPIDLITVTDHIERHQRIPFIENHQTAWFLCKLTNDVIHSAHLKFWCEVVRDMYNERVAARATPETLKQAGKQQKRAPSMWKTNRFLLTYVAKDLLKAHSKLFGSKIIAGSSTRKIKVSSPLLVFLMSIVEPHCTWTCGNSYDEILTNEQVKKRLPENAIFTNGTWIDKTNQYPAAWL